MGSSGSRLGGSLACRVHVPGRRSDHLQSAVFLPLPWEESADTWGWFAAIAGAAVTFVVLRLLSRHGAASKQ